MTNSANNSDDTLPKFQIFRGQQAQEIADDSFFYLEPMSSACQEGWPALYEAGYNEGHDTKLLFSAPGFSLTYVWFKSGLPLPRHSHDTDCLYYVIAGALQLGNETLSAGDGFFIGKNVPYAYVPCENGVEVLEFRSENRSSIKFLADNPAFWQRAVDEVQSRKSGWPQEAKPSHNDRS